MYEYNAKVVGIVDGDTFDAEVDVGFFIKMILRFRLLGVNTPEMHDNDPVVRQNAINAKQFVVHRILTKKIRITTEKDDAFGRWLANVWYPDVSGHEINLNDELLLNKMAVPYVKKK